MLLSNNLEEVRKQNNWKIVQQFETVNYSQFDFLVITFSGFTMIILSL